MSIKNASRALRKLDSTLRTFNNRIYQEVVIPLAQETLNKLNIISGIHLGEAANGYSKYYITPQTHKEVDICDELVIQNIGYGPGIYPSDYFDENKKRFNGGLSHVNCHCYLISLSTKEHQADAVSSQWQIRITPTGVVFINESEKVNRQIQGWGAQVSKEGKVTDIGNAPDNSAEVIIAEFEIELQKQIQVFINKELSGITK